MELKLNNTDEDTGNSGGLNRTFMELKLSSTPAAETSTWVLIEPLWN